MNVWKPATGLGLFVLGGLMVAAGFVSAYFGLSAAEERLALPYEPPTFQVVLVVAGLVLAGGTLGVSVVVAHRRATTTTGA